MFWNSEFLSVSTRHDDLLSQSTKLNDILFEDELLQELKTCNLNWINFLIRPEIIKELVDNITQLTEKDCFDKLLYSRIHAAYISCEILTIGLPEIFSALMQHPNHLNDILNCLIYEPDLSQKPEDELKKEEEDGEELGDGEVKGEECKKSDCSGGGEGEEDKKEIEIELDKKRESSNEKLFDKENGMRKEENGNDDEKDGEREKSEGEGENNNEKKISETIVENGIVRENNSKVNGLVGEEINNELIKENGIGNDEAKYNCDVIGMGEKESQNNQIILESNNKKHKILATKVVPQKATLISKLINCIHSNAPADLSCHITKNVENFSKLINVLVQNIHISGSFDILSTFINITTPPESRYVFCEILAKLDFVYSLINVMTLSDVEDKQRNACQLLCDIIVHGRQEASEHQQQQHQQQQQNGPPAQDMLAEQLESQEAVRLMLNQMFPSINIQTKSTNNNNTTFSSSFSSSTNTNTTNTTNTLTNNDNEKQARSQIEDGENGIHLDEQEEGEDEEKEKEEMGGKKYEQIIESEKSVREQSTEVISEEATTDLEQSNDSSNNNNNNNRNYINNRDEKNDDHNDVGDDDDEEKKEDETSSNSKIDNNNDKNSTNSNVERIDVGEYNDDTTITGQSNTITSNTTNITTKIDENEIGNREEIKTGTTITELTNDESTVLNNNIESTKTTTTTAATTTTTTIDNSNSEITITNDDINVTAVICGMKVLRCLIEWRKPNNNNIPNETIKAHETLVFDAMKKIQDVVEEYLIKFHELLLNPPRQEPIKTTFGVIQKPLGYIRLEVVNLIRALISVNAPKIIMKLVDLNTMNVIIDLFINYSWNNLLHTQVEQALCLIIKICRQDEDSFFADYWNKRLDELNVIIAEKIEVPSTPSIALLHQILNDCDLIGRLLKCRNGEANFGHILQIINSIAINCDLDIIKSHLKDIETKRPELFDRWNTFVSVDVASFKETSLYFDSRSPHPLKTSRMIDVSNWVDHGNRSAVTAAAANAAVAAAAAAANQQHPTGSTALVNGNSSTSTSSTATSLNDANGCEDTQLLTYISFTREQVLPTINVDVLPNYNHK